MMIKVIDGRTIDARTFSDAILDGLTDAVYFVDRNRRILYWNKAAEELSGYKAEDVIGTSCADGILMHVDGDGKCLCKDGCPLAAVMEDGTSRSAHVFMHHADGHRKPVYVRAAAIRDPQGDIIGSVEIFSDDTERLNVLERIRDLEQAAMLDELTGLANRRYFNQASDACLANFKRNAAPFGLAMIDVDYFKRVNDTHGHDVGDEVLRMIARTLLHNCRGYDTPVRWGGEEFILIAEHVDEDMLRVIAERTRVLIASSSLKLLDRSLSVTVSIGASMVRAGDDIDATVGRADSCLYKSKATGRNRTTIG